MANYRVIFNGTTNGSVWPRCWLAAVARCAKPRPCFANQEFDMLASWDCAFCRFHGYYWDSSILYL